MKHFLSRMLVVAALMAVGASVFAQLSVNGYYRVGGTYNAPDEGDKVVAFLDRIRLNLSFAAPDDMYGVKARLQADSSGTNSGFINLFSSTAKTTTTTTLTGGKYTSNSTTTLSNLGSLKYGEAYAKFLDGMLKLTAGKLDVTDYMIAESTGNAYLGNVFTDEITVAGGSILGGQKGNTTGAILQVWPIENLSAAFVMRTDGTEVKAHHYGLDAYYMVPGIGKALFASQIGAYSSNDDTAEDKFDKSFASLGFSYTGYAGLTATAAYRYNGNGNAIDGNDAAHGAIAIIEYNVAPIFVDLSGDFDLTNSHSYFEGEAAYTIIPEVKIRAYFGVTDDSDVFGSIKLLGSSVVNKSLYGADLVLPVGKAEAMIGLAYGDEAKLQMPLLIKANF
jgi:hypothetical protein